MPRGVLLARLVLLATVAALLPGCESAAERQQRVLAAAARAESEGDRRRSAELLATALRADPRQLALVDRLAETLLAEGRVGEASRVLAGLPSDVAIDDTYRRLRARARLRRCDCREGIALAVALAGSPAEDDSLVADLTQSVAASWPRCEAELAALPPAWLRRVVERLLDEGKPAAAATAWRHLVAAERRCQAISGPSGCQALSEALAGRIVARLLEESAADHVAGNRELVGPPLSVEKLLLAHRSALFAGRFAEATAAELAFARLFPQETGSYEMMLAMARRRSSTGNAAGALLFADRALELYPSGVEALVERGLALDRLGRTREARAAFEAVLAGEPGNASAQRFIDSQAQEERSDGTTVTLRLAPAAVGSEAP